MKYIYIASSILLFTISTSTLYSQSFELIRGAKYKLENTLTFKVWDGSSSTNESYTICQGSKIKISRLINDKAVIKIVKSFSYSQNGQTTCKTDAPKAKSYIIDQSVLKTNVKIPDILPQYGFLTVPFKYDISNQRMYPGGQIGGMLGVQKRLNWTPTESMSWFLVGTAGYSRIALNNSNIQNIEPSNTDFSDAFTYGIATGISINKFQFMIVKGWDKFSVEGEKTTLNWLMVGFGFGFVKAPNEQ